MAKKKEYGYEILPLEVGDLLDLSGNILKVIKVCHVCGVPDLEIVSGNEYSKGYRFLHPGYLLEACKKLSKESKMLCTRNFKVPDTYRISNYETL